MLLCVEAPPAEHKTVDKARHGTPDSPRLETASSPGPSVDAWRGAARKLATGKHAQLLRRFDLTLPLGSGREPPPSGIGGARATLTRIDLTTPTPHSQPLRRLGESPRRPRLHLPSRALNVNSAAATASQGVPMQAYGPLNHAPANPVPALVASPCAPITPAACQMSKFDCPLAARRGRGVPCMWVNRSPMVDDERERRLERGTAAQKV
ncbi:hypothetical protein EJ04DRAFT_510177 [Polyplosphaeria fusca]|uniref:Uncharacterized protein n=1 Tax=Polyplosphaeria fusca TaxID=682080 RepID=A0A9P4V5S0_9PLEO|nr:hypothetical protein EJ04DRAFT_510177 [Polyplosphaeria fusca]